MYTKVLILTTLPISKVICERYVFDEVKYSWFIDLLNFNLDLDEAMRKIELFSHSLILSCNIEGI